MSLYEQLTIAETQAITTILRTTMLHLRFGSFITKLAQFALCYRETNGIGAMKNYVVWAREHGEREAMIVTVLHDLNGMGDPLFLPRTSSYAELKQGESEC